MPVEASESAVLLFTDIVDSTRLMTSMSPDAAEETRRQHFAVLRESQAKTLSLPKTGMVTAVDIGAGTVGCSGSFYSICNTGTSLTFGAGFLRWPELR